MIRTYKYRVYPSKRIEQVLNDHLALCCELHNAAIQERRDAWKYQRKSVAYFDQAYQLTHIKKIREDLAAVNATALEHVLKRVEHAFDGFFKRVRRGKQPGYPRFRSVTRYDSLMIRGIGNALKGDNLRLSRIGSVRINLHRPIEGQIKTLTIKREAGRWFAVFSANCELAPLPESSESIGVDVGIAAFATFSDGSAIDNPRYCEQGQRQLRIAQRKMARRKKGSHQRQKAIQNKLSRTVINNFGLIAVEDLNVKGLARMRLAKQVHDAGWSSFIDKLTYKAESAGRLLIKVNPSGTSQTCLCGARVEKTLSQRWHECSACGLSAPRDHVSAQIILARGLRVQALTSPVAECVA